MRRMLRYAQAMRLFLALTLLSAAGCVGDETFGKYGAADRLWVLSEINGKEVSVPITLTVPTPGRIAGQADCVTYAAKMIAPYPWFETKAIETSNRTCEKTPAETRYLLALTGVTQSEVLNDTLILSGNGAELVFKAAE
jgi:heat shock protein HslJ